MADEQNGSDRFVTRTDWTRLQTPVFLRWLAIAGQLITLLITWRFFNIRSDAVGCLAIVGLSVTANVAAMLLFSPNRHLSEQEAFWVLIFDSCELAALLGLTGGLSNPFALLLLVPATSAATALNGAATAAMATVAIALVTSLAYFNRPLRFLSRVGTHYL